MELILPSWFEQRQAKAEPAGTDMYRLTAPNMKEAFISIHQDANGRWSAALRSQADGPEVASTPAEFTRPEDAWDAAFELYRTTLIV